MHLNRLQIRQFRNIQEADLEFSERLNLIHGDNGSGKTSLLEAIATLSRGHSFRTRKFTYLINHEAEQFSIFGVAKGEVGESRIGIVRHRQQGSQFKLNGRAVERSAELAKALPTQVLDAEAFSLLDGGPGTRRRFLDWLVFHVKHDFAEVWGLYARALKHRNVLLRHGKIQPADLEPWDEQLAVLGTELDRRRQDCVQLYIPVLEQLLTTTSSAARTVSLEYVPGWNREEPLLDQYRRSVNRDVRAGHTGIGPHRSDLRITVNGKPPIETLSRGQQKSLTSAMHVALLETFQTLTRRSCIVMVDDLAAELDDHHRQQLASALSRLETQVFATGIFSNHLFHCWPSEVLHRAKVFHVKHGVFDSHDRSSGEKL